MRERRLEPEVIDRPDLAAADHAAALRGLTRINRFSGSTRLLWPALRDLACEVAPRPVRVLDVATGAGDLPLRLWGRAQRAGLAVLVEGCDRSPFAVQYATEQAARRGADVRFFVLDALHDALPDGYDAITCSLFLHHLDDAQAVELLRRMGHAAGRLVLVNDLVRSIPGYVLAWLGCRVLSRSWVVHGDGPQSVAAAFTPAEARALAGRTGLAGVTVERRWPCRFLLTWRRSA
jgi:SAM-dependent methyltransferase